MENNSDKTKMQSVSPDLVNKAKALHTLRVNDEWFSANDYIDDASEIIMGEIIEEINFDPYLKRRFKKLSEIEGLTEYFRALIIVLLPILGFAKKGHTSSYVGLPVASHKYRSEVSEVRRNYISEIPTSKRFSKRLRVVRSLLYNAINLMIRNDGNKILLDYHFHLCMTKKRPQKVAMGACMRKLVELCNLKLSKLY